MKAVSLQEYPYPYKAMIAICSDLDETPDKDSYYNLMKFLNTDTETPMGKGLNLEIGNSMYFDMPKNQFSYWNTDDSGREMIRTLIKSGHIDCLHSFGDLATTRDHVKQALDELIKYGCSIKVWVDHAVAPTNFGNDIMKGHGDETGHPAYHSDITYKYGIRYVWNGRVTSVIGQNKAFSLRGIWDWKHPKLSGITILIELAKHYLAVFGNKKYRLHKSNNVSRNSTLRDGSKIIEFLRSNPFYGGVSYSATGYELLQVMNKKFLETLFKRKGICILYTHLGKSNKIQTCNNSIEAFKLLKKYYLENKICVTTTYRLLSFNSVVKSLEFSFKDTLNYYEIEIRINPNSNIAIQQISIEKLEGVTFEIATPKKTYFKIRNELIEAIVNNDNNKSYAFLPWKKLKFPN